MHPWVEAAFLGHVPDVAAGVEIDRSTIPPDRAGIGRQNAQRDAHRGRLSRAVRTDKTKDLARRYGEGHVFDGHHLAVPFGDLVNFQGRSHRASPFDACRGQDFVR